jgi:hypothetical protein
VPIAWLLNLDAEEELAAPAGWRRSPKLWRAIGPHREAAARALLGEGDVSLEPGVPLPDREGGWRGRAWCPTPSALAELTAAGAQPEHCPPLGVLARVNRRDFLLEHGLGLAEARWIRDEGQWRTWLGERSPSPARLKRGFGVAGRGQRTLGTGQPSSGDEAWVSSALALGGLLVEPELQPLREFVTHGLLGRDGSLELGPPREQLVTRAGAWRHTGPPVPSPWTEALQHAAREIGGALGAAGYFGPFGLDGYEYRDRRGEPRVQAAGDLNARYTMGWGTMTGVDPG